VLPSHKVPFRGLQTRIEQLRRHHDERLEATVAACRTPSSAIAVMRALFPRALDSHQLSFALGETLAHLNRLIASGAVLRAAGGDGVGLYRGA
jgi:hypothetical protein